MIHMSRVDMLRVYRNDALNQPYEGATRRFILMIISFQHPLFSSSPLSFGL